MEPSRTGAATTGWALTTQGARPGPGPGGAPEAAATPPGPGRRQGNRAEIRMSHRLMGVRRRRSQPPPGSPEHRSPGGRHPPAGRRLRPRGRWGSAPQAPELPDRFAPGRSHPVNGAVAAAEPAAATLQVPSLRGLQPLAAEPLLPRERRSPPGEGRQPARAATPAAPRAAPPAGVGAELHRPLAAAPLGRRDRPRQHQR